MIRPTLVTALAGRLLRAVAVAVALALLLWSLVELAPGSPADLLRDPDTRELPRCLPPTLLDGPAIDRLTAALTSLVPGASARSWTAAGCPAVWTELATALPTSLLLGAASVLLGVTVGALVGFGQSVLRGRLDLSVSAVTATLQSTPGFVVAMLIAAAAPTVGLPQHGLSTSLIGPAHPLDVARHLVAPVLAVSLLTAAPVARLTRAAAAKVLDGEVVRACRARGLSEGRVLWRHALPLAIGPAIQVVGLLLPRVVSGSVVVEVVFALPGMGSLLANRAQAQDLPVLVGAFALIAVMVSLGGLLADVLAAWVDPRLRGAS